MASLSDHVLGWVREGMGGAIRDRAGIFNDASKEGGAKAASDMGDQLSPGNFSMLRLFGGLEGIIGGLVPSLLGATRWVRSIAEGWALGSFFSELAKPGYRTFVQDAERLFHSLLIDPETAARLDAKGIAIEGGNVHEAAGGGMDSAKYGALRDDAYQQPALADMLELRRRGIAGDQDLAYSIHRLGIEPGWRDKLPQLLKRLLSPADLALANLRGELDQATMIELGAAMGVDEFDMLLLVGNQGEPPGPELLMEALRRDIIKGDRFDRGIRQSRVRNEWIDVLHAVRFHPMSAADAIAAHVEGHLDESTSRRKAAENGLDPDDWQPLYDTAGQPISREEALSLMHRNKMSEAQVIEAIRESRVKNKYIPNIIELGRRLIPYRTINVILEKGIKDHQWGVDYLVSLGYHVDDAEALVATSQASKTAKARTLTESQIMELYRAKGITAGDAVGLLKHLGYTAHDADELLKVQEAQRALTEQQRGINAIRANYVHHRISKQQAQGELDALGVLAGQRDDLLTAWHLEQRTVIKTLSAAQVASAVYYQVWTEDEGVKRLEQLGYSQQDARIIIVERLKGVPKGWHIGPPVNLPGE